MSRKSKKRTRDSFMDETGVSDISLPEKQDAVDLSAIACSSTSVEVQNLTRSSKTAKMSRKSKRRTKDTFMNETGVSDISLPEKPNAVDLSAMACSSTSVEMQDMTRISETGSFSLKNFVIDDTLMEEIRTSKDLSTLERFFPPPETFDFGWAAKMKRREERKKRAKERKSSNSSQSDTSNSNDTQPGLHFKPPDCSVDLNFTDNLNESTQAPGIIFKKPDCTVDIDFSLTDDKINKPLEPGLRFNLPKCSVQLDFTGNESETTETKPGIVFKKPNCSVDMDFSSQEHDENLMDITTAQPSHDVNRAECSNMDITNNYKAATEKNDNNCLPNQEQENNIENEVEKSVVNNGELECSQVPGLNFKSPKCSVKLNFTENNSQITDTITVPGIVFKKPDCSVDLNFSLSPKRDIETNGAEDVLLTRPYDRLSGPPVETITDINERKVSLSPMLYEKSATLAQPMEENEDLVLTENQSTKPVSNDATFTIENGTEKIQEKNETAPKLNGTFLIKKSTVNATFLVENSVNKNLPDQTYTKIIEPNDIESHVLENCRSNEAADATYDVITADDVNAADVAVRVQSQSSSKVQIEEAYKESEPEVMIVETDNIEEQQADLSCSKVLSNDVGRVSVNGDKEAEPGNEKYPDVESNPMMQIENDAPEVEREEWSYSLDANGDSDDEEECSEVDSNDAPEVEQEELSYSVDVDGVSVNGVEETEPANEECSDVESNPMQIETNNAPEVEQGELNNSADVDGVNINKEAEPANEECSDVDSNPMEIETNNAPEVEQEELSYSAGVDGVSVNGDEEAEPANEEYLDVESNPMQIENDAPEVEQEELSYNADVDGVNINKEAEPANEEYLDVDSNPMQIETNDAPEVEQELSYSADVDGVNVKEAEPTSIEYSDIEISLFIDEFEESQMNENLVDENSVPALVPECESQDRQSSNMENPIPVEIGDTEHIVNSLKDQEASSLLLDGLQLSINGGIVGSPKEDELQLSKNQSIDSSPKEMDEENMETYVSQEDLQLSNEQRIDSSPKETHESSENRDIGDEQECPSKNQSIDSSPRGADNEEENDMEISVPHEDLQLNKEQRIDSSPKVADKEDSVSPSEIRHIEDNEASILHNEVHPNKKQKIDGSLNKNDNKASVPFDGLQLGKRKSINSSRNGIKKASTSHRQLQFSKIREISDSSKVKDNIASEAHDEEHDPSKEKYNAVELLEEPLIKETQDYVVQVQLNQNQTLNPLPEVVITEVSAAPSNKEVLNHVDLAAPGTSKEPSRAEGVTVLDNFMEMPTEISEIQSSNKRRKQVKNCHSTPIQTRQKKPIEFVVPDLPLEKTKEEGKSGKRVPLNPKNDENETLCDGSPNISIIPLDKTRRGPKVTSTPLVKRVSKRIQILKEKSENSSYDSHKSNYTRMVAKSARPSSKAESVESTRESQNSSHESRKISREPRKNSRESWKSSRESKKNSRESRESSRESRKNSRESRESSRESRKNSRESRERSFDSVAASEAIVNSNVEPVAGTSKQSQVSDEVESSRLRPLTRSQTWRMSPVDSESEDDSEIDTDVPDVEFKKPKQVKKLYDSVFEEPPKKAKRTRNLNARAPKRYKPAKWVSKQLYDFLDNKLKEKYPLEFRRKAEEVVFSLVQVVHLCNLEYPEEDLEEKFKTILKENEICYTYLNFLMFCNTYLPLEAKKKFLPLAGMFGTPERTPSQKLYDPL